MRSRLGLVLILVLLAASLLAIVGPGSRDLLAPYRQPDGSLRIPGGALTPELQHALFGGNDLQPYVNLTHYALAPSPYPTAGLVPRGYLTPNPNVFVRPTSKPQTLVEGIARAVAHWFPPVDWGAAFHAAVRSVFSLVTWDARAAVTVSSTTVGDIKGGGGNTCTTSQTAGASDDAVLVLLSEAGTATYLSVSYGTVGLSLIAGTAANGGAAVRTEIWGYAGTLPGGLQTMTATLSGGVKNNMTCATILLAGVKSLGSFINGTTNTGVTSSATITFTQTVTPGNLGLAVTAIQQIRPGSAQPTSVTGTGAVATDLYGVAAPGHCTGTQTTDECGAGADIPNPGTAITWTWAGTPPPATTWVVSAVEVVTPPACGTTGGGNCYRIGTGGLWSDTTLWSSTPSGAACGCTPRSTDLVFFNATPTGTTTLTSATTVGALDMTGYTGTLDTTASNYALTSSTYVTIQGTLLARGSTITVAGNVAVLGATTAMTLGSSQWTVSGTWTNNSTSNAWSAGSSAVTIRGSTSGTVTFGNLSVPEFNNLTLDASVAAGVTYTMATNGLQTSGTLVIQNSSASATGPTILDTSASNLPITAGGLTLATLGAARTRASSVVVGPASISAASAYITNTAGAWTVGGSWTDSSTSASWSFAASITFSSTSSQTMTFGPQAGNEFSGAVTFDTPATTAVTYTMAANSLRVGGTLTIQDTAAGAIGPVLLDTSGTNLAIVASGLTFSALAALNARASTVTIGGNVNVGAGSAYILSTGGSWTVSGSWTDRTTSTSWSFAAPVVFRAGTSQAMIFTGSNIGTSEFAGTVTFDTTAIGGVTYTMAAGATGDSSLRVGGALTIRNGAAGATAATILDTSAGNFGLSAASLALGTPRGALRSQGSSVTIGGPVTISDANSYLVLGSASWTVSGAWTNGSTDGVDWSAGTGTLTFQSAGNATLTFGNLGVNEANAVVFDTSAPGGITYTMAGNGLRIAGSLTVQNTAAGATGNTVLTTGASNLPITAGGVVLGMAGTLAANASTITVNGSWTSTAANHAWSPGTSTVIFTTTGTLTAGAGDSFSGLTQSAGTTTLGSDVTASGAVTVNGTLDTSASSFSFTMQSTLSIGAGGVLNLEASAATTAGSVTIAAGGAVKFTGAGTWTVGGSWTNANTTVPASWAVGTATVRIVDPAGATLTFWTAPAGNEFYSLALDSSAAAGITYTQLNALRTASTLSIQNSAAGATGAVTLDASPTNYGSNVGGLNVGALGAFVSRGATVAVSGPVTVAATGYVTAASAGSWTVTGAWTNTTTSASWSFLAPMTFLSAANQTMRFKAGATEFGGAVTFDTTNASGASYVMGTSALTVGGLLTIRNSTALPTGNTVLDTSVSNLGITAASVTIGANGTLVAEGSTISVGGNWTATAANATFTPGTSTVVFTATATVTMSQAFHSVTVTAGTVTQASSLSVNATLTVSGGVLAKGTFTLTANTITLSGGALTSASGNVTVAGAVTVASAASYVVFGSEAWSVGGAWTNASASALWSAGTATVTFGSSTNQTLSFMAGSSNEFYNVTFNSGATTMTYTMAGNDLRVANALVVQGTTGSTTLSTSNSNLGITVLSLTAAAGGSLVANGSTIAVRSIDTSAGSLTPGTSTLLVTASGGTVNVPQIVNNLTVGAGISTTISGNLIFSGALSLTSATVTFSGNLTSSGTATIAFGSSVLAMAGSWDTSSASSFTATSSSVTFSGAATTIKLAAGQTFAALTASGTLTQLSQLSASGLTLTAGSWSKGPNPLTVSGDLVLSGGALISVAGAVAVTGNVTVTAGASYIQFGSESWVVGGAWTNASTSASWSAGTATVTFDSASAQTMTFAGANLTVPEFDSVVFDTTSAAGVTYTMAVRGLNLAGDLTVRNTAPSPTGNTVLTTSAGNLPITAAGTVAAAANGALMANGSTITFRSFNASSGTFNAGTSTLAAAITGGTISVLQALYNLSVNAGVTLSAASDLTVAGTLTVGGIFATLTSNLTVALLAPLSGGITAGAAGTKTFNGDVTVNAAGYFDLGGASWTIAGTWMDNSTSSSWTAGTGAVMFTSSSSRTMTFAALPGGAAEFHDVAFDAGASTVTFTMAGNPLIWSGTLSISGGAGTTLATGGLGLSGGALSVGNGGAFVANASAVGVTDVTMTGGASGAITLTTGAWIVSGSWDTSGAGSTLTAGTSTVTFTGASTTIALATSQAFYSIAVDGTASLSSNLTATGAVSVGNGATLTKTGWNLSVNSLSETGTGAIADGSVRVVNFTLTNSDPTNLTTISVISLWTLDGEFRWTHTSTVATSTLTFTLGGNTNGFRFNVTKDGVAFTTGLVNASGQVVFTMLGSDPVVDVVIAAPCGGTRYWVGGTGNWSDQAHWSATSGGGGGCNVPNGSSSVWFDGNSGGGTATVDQNAAMNSLDTTGWTGLLAVGAYSFAVGGNLGHASGVITVGASSGTGLTVAGNLSLGGGAVLDGSGAASVVTVSGNVSLTSGTAYLRMGSGTWTIAGSWSNASTSASWTAGTGTVVFTSATAQTMTFGGFGSPEFNNLTFSSTAPGAVTFTMGTNPLRWVGTLTIQDAGGSTTLATSDLPLAGGSLVVGNGGVLAANASTVVVVNVTMTAGTSGSLNLTTGSWTVSGNWDTSGTGAQFTKGTSGVALSGAGRTVRILDASNGFYNLTVTGSLTQNGPIDVTGTVAVSGTLTTAGNAITGGARLIISGGGSLFGMSATIAVSAVTMNDAAANTLSLTSGSVSVSGSWDTSGAASVLVAGSSTVTVTSGSGAIVLGATQSFADLVLSGTFALGSQLSASSLTISSGTLTKGTNPLSIAGDLLLSGGSLTSVSGDVAIGGSVSISAAASYIAFGSEAWTIGGAWTNASASSSWSAGTGTAVFDSGSSQTMTFAGMGLASMEFNVVVFDAGNSTVTFALLGSALRAQTVSVLGGTGITTVDTTGSGLAITADTVTVAAGGQLTAGNSTVTVRTMDTSAGNFVAGTSTVIVNVSGGSIRVPQALHALTVFAGIATTFASNIEWSATLTLTGATATVQGNVTASGPAVLTFAGATLTVGGSWDTSSAAAFVADGSTVTFTGTGQTVGLSASQEFAALVVAGNIALTSSVSAVNLTVSTGGAVTKTGRSIDFNTLTVSGTIIDGSVNVTGLTVANNDGAARVTISLFTTWNVGREYAWTHASNLSSQTITWTIQGNTVGFMYHATKDGASFADGTVAGSGQIVLAMPGSDPNMWIGVFAPPILPWWQSPYFLGVLPLPFLMVVTMFVQRRRWRPTKAFLVDERGQLMREFSLDPSCDVTYDQAYQAGALDAVDKDVRVAKYHARAVRGDMLSLVMLAVGPADVEETEFARGLLLGIQDKLEDSAKARVAEARNAEEILETTRAQADEERVDLQTRARVFGDMVNAFTIARTKLDADSQKLRKLDTNLREREANLAEVRTSLEDQTARAAERRDELDRTGAELSSKEQELQEAERALREREKEIGPRESAVEQRTKETSNRETDLEGRETVLSAARTQLTADLEEYHRSADRTAALQEELGEERKALDDLSLQLDEQTKALEGKTSAVSAREKEVSDKSEELQARLSELGPREQSLGAREADLASAEKAQTQRDERLASREKDLEAQVADLRSREAALAGRAQDLTDERKALDELTDEAVSERKALDAKTDDLVKRETEVAAKIQDLEHLTANLGPRESALFQKESDLAAREKTLADERRAFQNREDLVATKALEITQQTEQLKEREGALAENQSLLRDAKAAFETQERELAASKADFAKEEEQRKNEIATQERTLGEARLRLTKETEGFEAQRLEKGQWIASKEIELEAREQSLSDREKEIRAQAEDNARHLSELAAREETLEIEGDKVDKARADLEARKAEVGALARDLETRTARFREEESKKGEELRTWQATLDSEQALLKEQRETFEKEMLEVRESWAGRMIRVEQREEELQQREAKVQADIEWVAKNESELSTREKTAAETLKAATDLQTRGERLRAELEQRAMEVESRERDVREEAAEQSVALEKRAEALQTRDAELEGKRAQWERELADQVQKMKRREAEVQARKDALDAQEADLASREETLSNGQGALRQDGDRLAREKADALSLQKQLETGQLELAQARERLEAESLRSKTEADAVRQSLAAKDADLTSERERLERESSALQDKLGAKAKEMASREKAVAAHEDELRAEEQDLDTRLRAVESRERQAEAHLAELNARADALSRGETELKSHRTAFDEAVRSSEVEAAARQKEWKGLQETLKSQEARLAASTETRQAEIRKRMEELEQRERSINASQTQAQIERSRLEAQAKTQAGKQAELEAAAARADKRFAELKAMEGDVLRGRQEFETERAAWSSRRSEELRQLEATRDAAAEQTQQAERLIQDSQRRAYVAAEAEKAAKRQSEELAAAQALQEKRRADAEKAERDLEAQMVQLREASQRLGTRELELASRTKELDALETRLAAADKRQAETADSLNARKTSLDQEAERVAVSAAQADKRAAELESRHTTVETKLAEVTKREQILSTELQRADNLMVDLGRKDAELQAREKGLSGRDQDLAARERTLDQRDAELREGMQTLDRLRHEQEGRTAQLEQEYRAAADARKEADAVRTEAEKLKTQADAMQTEVAKNMRFLQKKALDVLDREEKTRAREAKVDEQGRLLESRSQILDQKDRVFDTEKSDLTERLERMRLDNEKLKAKLAETEASSKRTIDMDEWKRDIENRVKIIQKKALELLDREEKLRKKEDELRALADQLGVSAKA